MSGLLHWLLVEPFNGSTSMITEGLHRLRPCSQSAFPAPALTCRCHNLSLVSKDSAFVRLALNFFGQITQPPRRVPQKGWRDLASPPVEDSIAQFTDRIQFRKLLR